MLEETKTWRRKKDDGGIMYDPHIRSPIHSNHMHLNPKPTLTIDQYKYFENVIGPSNKP